MNTKIHTPLLLCIDFFLFLLLFTIVINIFFFCIGLKTLTGVDASGSESHGRKTRAPRDPRPQFWENVTQKHFDNVLNPPSHIDPVNTGRMFQYAKQHYHNDHNKNNEEESSEQLNMVKRWSRSKGFYHGDTGKEKDKNMNVLGEGSDEIEETRKRPRLNWGDGLAKFEKKKRDVEGVSSTSAVDSTPTSVSCSSLSGILLSLVLFLVDLRSVFE